MKKLYSLKYTYFSGLKDFLPAQTSDSYENFSHVTEKAANWVLEQVDLKVTNLQAVYIKKKGESQVMSLLCYVILVDQQLLKTANRKQQNTDNVLLLVENYYIMLQIFNKLNQSETLITVMSGSFYCEDLSTQLL